MERAVAQAAAATARHVVKAMEASKFTDCQCYSADCSLWLDCIAGQTKCRTAERSFRSLDVFRVAPDYHHSGAILRKIARGGKAQARRAADDHQCFAVELQPSHVRG